LIKSNVKTTYVL